MKRCGSRPWVVLTFGAFALIHAGCIDERCYDDAHCPAPKVCGPEGRCAWKCVRDPDCGIGFVCREHVCVPGGPADPDALTGDLGRDAVAPVPICPDDMALVANTFCVDRHEASRPDATASFAGVAQGPATSRAGVLPWMVPDNATADAACQAAGKRLCTPAEWEYACKGPEGTVYAYGEDYDPATCNGIDTYCRCDTTCASVLKCPYAGCFGSRSPAQDGGPCQADFRLEPTGTFPDCTNAFGVFDMNGNLWEHVRGGGDRSVRGGAFNCSNSKKFHRCDYVPGTWTPSALGFRCCQEPDWVQPGQDAWQEVAAPDLPFTDAPWTDLPPADAGSGDAPSENGPSEGGCLDPDPGPGDSGADAGVDPGGSDPGADPGTDPGTDPGVPPAPCPSDMVRIRPVATETGWCLDRYEASRADATASTVGTSAVATSRDGVLPWWSSSLDLPTVASACAAAGKRPCTVGEWVPACSGTSGRTYVYGSQYVANACNGIDAFCDCAATCATVALCPYPHCRVQSSPAGDGGPCGANFHLTPTGSFPACVNEWGAFDINGNAWELVVGTDGLAHLRGGAYNCGDSEWLHRCDTDVLPNQVNVKGFRCCRDVTSP